MRNKDTGKGDELMRMSQILWAVALYLQREVELRLTEVLEVPGCRGDLLLCLLQGSSFPCSDDLGASLPKGLLSF